MPQQEAVMSSTTPDRVRPSSLLTALFIGALAALGVVGCSSAARQHTSGAATTSSNPTAATGSASALQITFRRLTPDSDDAAMTDYNAVVQHGRAKLTVVTY